MTAQQQPLNNDSQTATAQQESPAANSRRRDSSSHTSDHHTVFTSANTASSKMPHRPWSGNEARSPVPHNQQGLLVLSGLPSSIPYSTDLRTTTHPSPQTRLRIPQSSSARALAAALETNSDLKPFSHLWEIVKGPESHPPTTCHEVLLPLPAELTPHVQAPPRKYSANAKTILGLRWLLAIVEKQRTTSWDSVPRRDHGNRPRQTLTGGTPANHSGSIPRLRLTDRSTSDPEVKNHHTSNGAEILSPRIVALMNKKGSTYVDCQAYLTSAGRQ
jgi:hypothetical protein